MLSRVKIVIVIAAIAVLGSLFISNWLRTIDNRPTVSPQLTTLEDIIAGKFPTASDKQGTNGILVEVDGLRVTRVHKVFDEDWHIDVTDGKVRLFITEVTPYWLNHGVTVPAVGSVIDEIGYVYCDTEHENETFHGNTCWEIHPVIKWTLHGTSTQDITSNGIANLKFQESLPRAKIMLHRNSVLLSLRETILTTEFAFYFFARSIFDSSLEMKPSELRTITSSHSTGSNAVTLKILANIGTWNMNGIMMACPKTTSRRDLFPRGPAEKNVRSNDLQLSAKKISNSIIVAKTMLRALISANSTG